MLVRETTAMRAAAAVSSRRRPLAVRAARTQDVVSSTTTSRDNKNRQNTSGAGAGVVQKFLSRQHLAKDFTKQLKISESYWNGMKRGGGGQGKAKTVVEQMPTTAPTALHGLVDYDVCVCGGNLGIAIALALQKRGYRVLIIERRLLRGRTQEWNASRREMRSLIRTGLLTESEVEDAIISEFNPNRVTFKEGEDVWVNDVLNIGVAPDKLIRRMKEQFVKNGGAVRELCEFKSATMYDDMAVLKVRDLNSMNQPKSAGGAKVEEVELDLIDVNKPNALPTDASFDEDDAPIVSPPEGGDTITCSLVIDCMGHFSPIVKQLRDGAKPESIVLVVGGCASEGVPKFTSSDILASFTDAERDMQCFWETFPAKEGTTMYMFTYCDADESRVSFEGFLESFLSSLQDYCKERLESGKDVGIQLPPEEARKIQGTMEEFLDDVQFERLLFGAFPSYKRCPLNSPYDRLILVGDSSAVQSPLSFGGFGAMLRHLPRLDEAIHEALEGNHLKAKDLKLVQPYMPSLSAAWLFQQAMGFEPHQMGYSSENPAEVATGSEWTKTHINRVLKANFSAMKTMDKKVLLSFLQDTIMFWPLTKTMFAMSFVDPIAIFRVVYLLGFKTLSEWTVHYTLLGFYALLDFSLGRFRNKTQNFYLRRYMDAWHYGSGSDYEDH